MSELATHRQSVVRTSTACATAAPSAPHVLIAGGDDRTREARERQLHMAGFRVSVARTGFEAIVKASCQVPDLIMLDDSLTDLDATETGRLLTTCPVTSHIPVVRLPRGRTVPQRVLSRVKRPAPSGAEAETPARPATARPRAGAARADARTRPAASAPGPR
jgi:CheY-like chemotaxis protein